MRRLAQWYREWLCATHERARMARVEEELRIKHQLDYLASRDPNYASRILTVTPAERKDGVSLNDIHRRL